ncbi:protein OPI10 homolog [Daktulosphaira vitifoliae]|uniref:protein OPI10 homolog n=1 Tax=Daktulosphaira vitifoliae TaxID=58002 RepID=UPI0021AA90BE|nr:protein OPI10 homolog [Daktulosphaira vitifoliae]
MADPAQSMFGLLVSGRLVRTDFECIEETKLMITIPSAESVNYICVFLTGLIPFPEGTAGFVYFSWPDDHARPNWQLLGILSNQKPSAIYKLSNLKKHHVDLVNEPSNAFSLFPSVTINAQIGISIEPLIDIEAQVANTEPVQNVSTFIEFTQKMVQNLFNYVSSYAIEVGPQQPPVVPLTTIQKWYENFERKMSLNPNFWKS